MKAQCGISKKRSSQVRGCLPEEGERPKSRQRSNSNKKQTKAYSQAQTQITSARKGQQSGHKRKESKDKRKSMEGTKVMRKKSSKKRGRESMDMTYLGSNQGDMSDYSLPLRRKRVTSRGFSPTSNDSFSHDEPQHNPNKRSCTPLNGRVSQHKQLQVVNAQIFDSDPCLSSQNDQDYDHISALKGCDLPETCPTHENDIDLRATQKELLQCKSKLYEYRYKVESLKKKLAQKDSDLKEAQEKFGEEQTKSDEFYAKCEKYKLQCRECKKEVEKLKRLVERQEIIRNREEVTREKEEGDRAKEAKIALKYTYHQLKKLQSREGPTNEVLSEVYEGVRRLAEQALGQNLLETKEINQSQQNVHYIGDGQLTNQFKVSQDEIVFNGESLPSDESYQLHGQNYSIDSRYQRGPSHQTSCNPYNQSLSGQKVFPSQDLPQSHSQQNQSVFAGGESNSSTQYDMLLRLQGEVQKVRDESKKVVEENMQLAEKNEKLKKKLDAKSQEQSLLPQYKEAFDQMRQTNEALERKVREMCLERKDQMEGDKLKKEIEGQISEMKYRMQKFEYENKNLREEREVFLNQIQSLETYNKTQEKMLSYFQNSYQQIIQQFQQQQNMLLQPNIYSLNSTNQVKFQQTDPLQVRSLDSNGIQQLQLQQQQHFPKQRNYGQIQMPLDFQEMQRFSYDQTPSGQFENMDQQMLLHQDTQSPQSQAYFSNRSATSSSQKCYEPQMVLMGGEQLLCKRQSVPLCPALQSQQNQRMAQSQYYMETGQFEGGSRNEGQQLEKEDLFSLSSTQPEMKLMSPSHTFKQIDFNKQVNSTAHAQVKQMIEAEYQIPGACQTQKHYPPTTTSQKTKQLTMSNVEEIKSSSQEITNRDKQSSNLSKTFQGSSVVYNYNQILEMDEKEESISSKISSSNNFNEMDALTEKSTCKNNEEKKKFFPKQVEFGSECHAHRESKTQQILKNQDMLNNGEYLCSQDTFNAKDTMKVQEEEEGEPVDCGSLATSKQSSSSHSRKNSRSIVLRQEHLKKSSSKKIKDKENQKQQQQQQYFQQPLSQSFNHEGHDYSNLKSPTFLECDRSDKHEADSDMVAQKKPSSKRNGEFSNQAKAGALQESSLNQMNQGGSLSSNFMSERTLNLKKEITSLDEEIIQLQNSLKQALMRKESDD